MQMDASVLRRRLHSARLSGEIQRPVAGFPIIDAAQMKLRQRAQHGLSGGRNQKRPLREFNRRKITALPDVTRRINQQIAAIFATAIITTMPAIEYSGFITPVSSLSADGQFIGGAFASTYFLHLSLGTFTKALDLPGVGLDLLALSLIAVVITAIARAALPAQEA